VSREFSHKGVSKVEMSPMKRDKIALSQRQLQKGRVMSLVEAGKITLRKAADQIGRSYREAKQIWKQGKEKGAV
jgi:hypothetical protein